MHGWGSCGPGALPGTPNYKFSYKFMDSEINYLAVLVCSILAMVLGYLWYGPFFGEKWMKITGADQNDLETRKKMQRNAGFLYFIQFLMTLFQVWILAYYIVGWQGASGLENSLWIWAAFVMPVVAGSAMWNNDSKQVSKTRFFIQGGYQLTLFVMFGLILGFWR